jgi:hypothetical protein
MYTVTVSDRTDRGYPFQRNIFENPVVLYHGTWSSYASKIEKKGFLDADLPFNLDDIKTIMNARERIGIGSYATSMVLPRTQKATDRYLSMTPNYWYARAYATDGGGETVRIMAKEARDFEDINIRDERRLALKAYWEGGLRKSPTHAETLRVVELLSDKQALHTLGENVIIARERLESATKDGFPIVYAIEVEPDWFPKEEWDDYKCDLEEGRRALELRCACDHISPDRLVAKAIYPNGTDSTFTPDWFDTWKDVEALSTKEKNEG